MKIVSKVDLAREHERARRAERAVRAQTAAEQERERRRALPVYEACTVPGCAYAWSPRYTEGQTTHRMGNHMPGSWSPSDLSKLTR